jgi:hypothetical protein
MTRDLVLLLAAISVCLALTAWCTRSEREAPVRTEVLS